MFPPSARGVEPQVHCDDDRWSHLGVDQKSARASASSVDSVSWDSPGSPWSSLLRSRSLRVGSRLKMGPLPDNFAVLSANHNMNSPSFCLISTLFRVDSSRIKYLMHPIFPNLPDLLSEYLLSKFPPATYSGPRKILGKTFLPNWWSLDWSLEWNRMIFNHCFKRYYWPFEWFSKSSFITEFHASARRSRASRRQK